MKWNRYNFIMKQDDNNYLIYNCLTNRLMDMSLEMKKIIDDNTNSISQLASINPKLFRNLKKNKFIVNDKFDEVEVAIRNLKKNANPTDHFDLIINPTLDCNLRCYYCYETHQINSVINDFTMRSITNLIKNKVKSKKIRHITISFFGGEPLLKFNKVIWPIIEYAQKLCLENNKRLDIWFTTNGVLLSRKIIDRLFSSGITCSFQVPFDGNKEFHDKVKKYANGKGTFDTIINHVLYALSKGFYFIIRCNYTTESLKSFDELISLFAEVASECIEYELLSFSFHRIWQEKDTNESKDVLKRLVDECIDSLIQQRDITLEFILVNDGSTDRSGLIAEQYAKKDNRFKLIHQINRGLSAARNAGMKLAQGEYIVFIDSDDWVKENSFCSIFCEALKHQADVLMYNIWFCHQERGMYYPFNFVPDELRFIPLSGKEFFLRLVKANAYPPMVWNYIFRRNYLEKIQVNFEEGMIYEDELWTPIILCQANTIINVDVDVYYYRQRDDSIRYTMNNYKRFYSLLQVANRLMKFSDHFDFSGETEELKNWWYVNIFRLYAQSFSILSRIKDSSYTVPTHYLDRFWIDCIKMMPEAQKICKIYYRNAEISMKKYTDWRTSDWVASMTYQIEAGKKIMLIYNTLWDSDLDLSVDDVPTGWLITTDRRFFKQADAVVFHLPDLSKNLESDLGKPQGQIWVAWYMESEKIFQLVNEPEIQNTFDLWMSYRQNADVVYSYCQYKYLEILSQQILTYNRESTCMFISNWIDEKNQKYLKELMVHTKIDSYGNLFNNMQQPVSSKKSISDIYRNYKFVISFENTIDSDYVTDIFFEPLLAGSVPIYLGAPNIEDFSPGNNCFVDVRQYPDPKLLAQFINSCCCEKHLYSKFFEWKNQPFKPSFLNKLEIQKEHPLIRLCQKIDEKLFFLEKDNFTA